MCFTGSTESTDSKPFESLKNANFKELDQWISKQNLDLYSLFVSAFHPDLSVVRQDKTLIQYDKKLYGEQCTPRMTHPKKPMVAAGERVLVDSIDQFKSNFHEWSSGVLTSEFWDMTRACANVDIVVAGGSVYQCLQRSKLDNNDGSDVDIWICGKNKEDRYNAVKQVLSFFAQKAGSPDNIRIGLSYVVVTVTLKGVFRHFQIVCSDTNSVPEMLHNFDLVHCQCYYDGNDVKVSWPALKSMSLGQAFPVSSDRKVQDKRWVKALHRGLSIPCTKNNGWTTFPKKFVKWTDELANEELAEKLQKNFHFQYVHDNVDDFMKVFPKFACVHSVEMTLYREERGAGVDSDIPDPQKVVAKMQHEADMLIKCMMDLSQDTRFEQYKDTCSEKMNSLCDAMKELLQLPPFKQIQ